MEVALSTSSTIWKQRPSSEAYSETAACSSSPAPARIAPMRAEDLMRAPVLYLWIMYSVSRSTPLPPRSGPCP